MNLNNKNDHKNCGFAENTMAYLYGELETHRKVNFETHLAKCDSCADEIADFTALRSKIADWKMQNFDVLATPVIEIAYEQHAPAVEIQTDKISWFDSLKNALIFSPSTAMIAAAIVLALFGGISYLTLNSDDAEVAGNPTTEVVNSPVIADKNQDSKVEPAKEPVEFTAPEIAENKSEKTENKNDFAPAISEPKISEKRQSAAAKREKPKQAGNIVPKNKTVNAKKVAENDPTQAQLKMPKLNTLPDDEEIDELSLSDLLADVDAK